MLNKKIKIIISVFAILAFSASYFFYFHYQVYQSKGSCNCVEIFKIEKGEKIPSIAERLERRKLISGKLYFYYYLKLKEISGRVLAGEYELRGEMTIPDIVAEITREQNKFLKVTFPEGWDSKKFAERLSDNGFSGKEFLEMAETPPREITDKYSFFSLLPANISLEGYLFPDTYFFSQKLSVEEAMGKIIANFDNQLDSNFREEIKKQGKSLLEIVTMASIIEKEVRNDEDRRIASGIFWKRIKNEQPLQSCATISYILGVNKNQYSFEDTRIPSPYNTYLNKGLPPAPICNPGSSSIKASIYPQETNYNYFLSDPETGKTVFSRTIEEHNANKAKFGL